MDPSINTPLQPQPDMSPEGKPSKSRFQNPWLWVGVVLIAILLGLGAFLMLRPGQQSDNQKAATDTKTQALFYDTLANAAQQPSFRVGMYRALYTSQADADSGKEPAALWSTISELNTTKDDYRSVYAYRLPENEVFTVGRCLTGRDFRNFRTPADSRPKTLQSAASELNNLQAATIALPNSTCPKVGINPSGIVDISAARLSDGLFPVTFNQEEANKWIENVKAANLFDIKDEGTAEKDGQTLRKISFTPKSSATNVNKKLYQLFVDTVGQEAATKGPYLYISIGLENAGGIKGYYLVDETKKLPVYSELSNVLPEEDYASSGVSAAFNVVHTKQNYSYASELTLNETTPLDFTE